MKTPVLFTQKNSVYDRIPDADPWNIDRDARSWPGGSPLIAHPPCRLWSRLRGLSTAPAQERELALWATKHVRRWGGVLEHPASSTLWKAIGAKSRGEIDEHGGFLLTVDLNWWGYPARKPTALYIVGVAPRDIPTIPYSLDALRNTVGSSKRRTVLPEVTRSARSATPEAMAHWLICLCRRAKTVRQTSNPARCSNPSVNPQGVSPAEVAG